MHSKYLHIGVIIVCAFAAPCPITAQTTDFNAERRIALIVSVGDYETLPDLPNTGRDGELIAGKLRALSFGVITARNPRLHDLRELLAEFAFQAETADVALIYFAGHGIEFAGRNFLLPADMDASDRAKVLHGAVSLRETLNSVERARQLRIVVLDSCRSDPFDAADIPGVALTRSQAPTIAMTQAKTRGGVGLVKPTLGRGTLVVYAAEAGQAALDGDGANSPFAEALAETISTPDLEIGLLFRQVRDRVLKTTAGHQVPHVYGSISGNPYFLAGSTTRLNTLESVERKQAWASLSVDHEAQLRALANDGNLRAKKGLAYMRLNPEGRSFDPTHAAELLAEAATAGDPEAMYEFGRLLEQGIGVDQDLPRSIALFRQAAAMEHADAINDLGVLTFNGATGIPRDPKRAVDYLARAADLRHPEAMFNYAALIDDGLVAGRTPQDVGQYLYDALRSGNDEVLAQLTEAPNMFKPASRRALQEILKSNGFYSGQIDASFGPMTRRSLRTAYGIREE